LAMLIVWGETCSEYEGNRQDGEIALT
jgi:hypothetical protein